jgi:hypothetical protein
MLMLNLDSVLQSVETPAFVKEAVRELKKKGGLTVGNFVQTMSTVDIDSALDCCEIMFQKLQGAKGPVFLDASAEGFLILAEVLSIGEGLDLTEDMKVLSSRLNNLKIYLTVESMKRQKLPFTVLYENMSLGEDGGVGSKPMAIMDGVEITVNSIVTKIKEMTNMGPAISDRKAENTTAPTKSAESTSLNSWLNKS